MTVSADTWAEHSWPALGGQCRAVIWSPDGSRPSLLDRAETELEEIEQSLSRFRPDSETSRINASKDESFEVSPLFAQAFEACRRAALVSGGLVDFTVAKDLVEGGYEKTRAPELDWADAWQDFDHHLAKPSGRWKSFELDGTLLTRPAGVHFDPAGAAKGWACDRLLSGMGDYSMVSLCGDMASSSVWSVELVDPRDEEVWGRITLDKGAAATSSLCRRLWLKDGHPWHHLLCPHDGKPVFCGLAGVCALGKSAFEADLRAKLVLLTGSVDWLEDGGVIYPANPADAPQVIGPVEVSFGA